MVSELVQLVSESNLRRCQSDKKWGEGEGEGGGGVKKPKTSETLLRI